MYGRTNASSKKLVLSSTISSAVDAGNTKRFKITVTIKDQDGNALHTNTGYTNAITSTISSAVDSGNTKRYKITETVKDSGNTTMLTSTTYTNESAYNSGDSAGYTRGWNSRQSEIDNWYNKYVTYYNAYYSTLDSYNSMVSERDNWWQIAYNEYLEAIGSWTYMDLTWDSYVTCYEDAYGYSPGWHSYSEPSWPYSDPPGY